MKTSEDPRLVKTAEAALHDQKVQRDIVHLSTSSRLNETIQQYSSHCCGQYSSLSSPSPLLLGIFIIHRLYLHLNLHLLLLVVFFLFSLLLLFLLLLLLLLIIIIIIMPRGIMGPCSLCGIPDHHYWDHCSTFCASDVATLLWGLHIASPSVEEISVNSVKLRCRVCK